MPDTKHLECVKMVGEKIFDLDSISNDYILTFKLRDKYSEEIVLRRDGINAKLGVKQILDILKVK